MPRNRNRTVTNNFEFPPEFLKTLPYLEKVNVSAQKESVNPLSFGEPVASQYSTKTYKDNRVKKSYTTSSSSDCDNGAGTSGVSDYDIISFGKSSSSSVSWSDEFDTEATQRVQNEFERMERVLQGKEEIPPHYNRDEYEQWIKTFPQLSITGYNMKCPIQLKQSNQTSNSHEEVFAFHSDMTSFTGNYDSDPTSSELKKINDIKNTVIDQVLSSITSKLLNTRSINKNKNPITRSRNQNDSKHQKVEQLNQNATQNLAHEFDSFLRISPVSLQKSANKNHEETKLPSSSNSISRSDKMASKWMREEPIEYSSLPYVVSSAKNKSRKIIGRKNSASSKTKYSSKVSPSRNNNYVSLPPIKTLSLPSANHYRSISATPRHQPKGLSAASMQGNSFLAGKKSHFEVTNYLVQNDLEPTKNFLKHRK